VKIGDTWTKNRKYRRYIGIADIFSSKISISYRFGKSGIDPSLDGRRRYCHGLIFAA